MKVLNCISIDDEEHCNEFLKECCLKVPYINLLATFTDPFAARQLLQSGKIDLVFLDFNMGNINASEFVDEIPQTVQIVIVSGELESKIKEYGIKLSGILLKPYRFERFLQICKIVAKLKI